MTQTNDKEKLATLTLEIEEKILEVAALLGNCPYEIRAKARHHLITFAYETISSYSPKAIIVDIKTRKVIPNDKNRN